MSEAVSPFPLDSHSRSDNGSVDTDHSTVPKFEVDLPRIERAVREILAAIGEDPERDGLLATPARGSPGCTRRSSPGCTRTRPVIWRCTFEADHDEMVMVKDIPLYSVCEHHLVPWFGRAHVAYIPNEDGRITGLSKLARLVDGFSRRPQVQERLDHPGRRPRSRRCSRPGACWWWSRPSTCACRCEACASRERGR